MIIAKDAGKSDIPTGKEDNSLSSKGSEYKKWRRSFTGFISRAAGSKNDNWEVINYMIFTAKAWHKSDFSCTE